MKRTPLTPRQLTHARRFAAALLAALAISFGAAGQPAFAHEPSSVDHVPAARQHVREITGTVSAISATTICAMISPSA